MRMLTPLSSMDIGPRLTASGTWFAILFLLLVPRSIPAQEAAPLRVVTVTAGVGHAMGWYGAQGERYFGPTASPPSSARGTRPVRIKTSPPALPSPQASAATPRGSGTAGSWRPRSARSSPRPTQSSPVAGSTAPASPRDISTQHVAASL